jgi:hypothetical protein
MAEIWYVAYGSNMSRSYFVSRFQGVHTADPIPWTAETWNWLPHELYFAGSSRTWGGSAVAFLSLEASSESQAVGRAYLIDRSKFDEVLDAEHLSIPQEWDLDIEDLRVGAWCPLPTPAKYNAVLRLSDIDGTPAFAITTARNLEYGSPSEAYLSTCREGLSAAGLLDEVDAYLASAVERSLVTRDPTVPPLPGAPLAWRRRLTPLRSTGYPTVHLGASEAWLGVEGPFPGRIEADRREASVWLFPPRSGQPEGASPQVYRALGFPPPFPDSLHCRVTAAYPIRFRRLPGISEDIQIADQAQVAPESARRLGEWALLIAPSLSGPVRLSPREHVPPDAVRVSYATRELWELDADEGEVSLLPLGGDKRDGFSFVRRAGRWLLEATLGAPAVPLRATEAVVGDEGRAVVRLDGTGLDFLGINAGDQIIVSWAGRETIARALLQTDDLRARMRNQLAQATGRQSRLATRAASDPDAILWHLQVWLSPAVRDALVIPPDTVVRLRRSVFHLVLRNLIALPLPIAGLIIAALAVPGLPWAIWIVVPILAVILAFVPLRLPRT